MMQWKRRARTRRLEIRFSAPNAPNVIDQVVREYGPYLRRILMRQGVHEPDVDDMLQEVWLIFGTYAGGLSGDPRAWLVRVAIHRAGNYYQRRRTAQRYPLVELDHDALDPHPDPEQWLMGDDVARALENLDPKLRAVINGRMAGETTEETSARLQIPEGTCTGRLRRARAILKAALACSGASIR